MSDHLVLLSGLASSLPLIGRRYTAWARQLDASLTLPSSVKRWVLSSDGAGEKPALSAILADHRKGLLGTVVFIGHSNGARDTLFMAETLYSIGIEVRYAATLDMTLGEFGAKAFGSIKELDEFHARLQTVDFDPSFKKNASTYHKFEIDKGHVAMASDPFVQSRLRRKIEEAFKA